MATVGELKYDKQVYDDFLDDIVDMYIDRLKREAEGADPEDEEKIEKELSTPTGDLRYFFSCQVDDFLSTTNDKFDLNDVLWRGDFALDEIDRLLGRG